MTRLTKLWIALAAGAITALLTVAAGLFASQVMRVFFAHHDQWWWPLVTNGLASAGWVTPLVAVGIAVYLRRVRRAKLGRLLARTRQA